MLEKNTLCVDGDENEVSRIRLQVLLSPNGKLVEADLYGPLNAYLTKYNPERLEEMEKIIKDDFTSSDVRELFLQRVGAVMSIGSDEVVMRYSLATPCPTHIYRKVEDSATIISCTGSPTVLRNLDYILLKIEP